MPMKAIHPIHSTPFFFADSLFLCTCVCVWKGPANTGSRRKQRKSKNAALQPLFFSNSSRDWGDSNITAANSHADSTHDHSTATPSNNNDNNNNSSNSKSKQLNESLYNHQVGLRDFDIVKEIARGGFGKVYLAQKKKTGAALFSSHLLLSSRRLWDFTAVMLFCGQETYLRSRR